MDENFMPCDDYMLKFSERWLLLRRSDTNVMLILGGDKANLASTRMVTNMTMKHITPALIAQLGGKPAPAPIKTATTPPLPASSTAAPFPVVTKPQTTPPQPVTRAATPAVAVAEPKTVRMYRGRPY
jgi:hypothetical protein